MIKKYVEFIVEKNIDQAKSIISKKMMAYDKLKDLLSKNLGYIGKFTDYLFNENIPYMELEKLYKELLDLKNKQHPIDISSMKYEDVLDVITETKNDILVNGVINKFPSDQKKMAKDLLGRNYNLFLELSKKENLNIFLSKVSRYKDVESFLNAIKLFVKSIKNDRETVKELIKGTKSRISFVNDDILIVEVKEFNDIDKFGSDTSWCILSRSMWDNYTKGNYQFVLYDYTKDEFDPKFKIGFTVYGSGEIKTAHDILDSYSVTELKEILNKYNIDTDDLIVKIDVSDDQINSIKRTVSLSSLREIASGCKINQVKLLIKKMLDVGLVKTTSYTNSMETKSSVFFVLLNRYFDKMDLITFKDLNDLDDRIIEKNLISGKIRSRLINLEEFKVTGINDEAFFRALDVWNKKLIINTVIKDGLYYFNNILVKSEDILLKMLSILKSDERTDVFSYLLIQKLNKDYNKNIENNIDLSKFDIKNSYLIRYYDLFKMSIELKDSNDFSEVLQVNSRDVISYITKKDYLFGVWLSRDRLRNKTAFFNKILEHLKDNKILFTIKKTDLNAILKNISKYQGFDYYNKLIDLLFKFSKNKGDEVSSEDGKIILKNKVST